MKKKNNREGFSLLEILFTLALVGIIIGLVVPNLTNMNQTARNTQLEANLSALARTYEAGKAMGVVWDTSSKEALAKDLLLGRSATSGAFKGVPIKVSGVTEVPPDLLNLITVGEKETTVTFGGRVLPK